MRRLILIVILSAMFSAGAQEPTIKNGLESFVKANTIYPMFALDHCIQGTIEVGFKLNKEGKVRHHY